MERGLQELLSIFGLLIGPHVSVVVVAGSHVATCHGETGKTSREFNVWKMCFHLPIYALTLFCMYEKPPQASLKTFCELEDFFIFFFDFGVSITLSRCDT